MVYVSRSYRCDKCRKSFRSYREAEDCELDHAVKGIANSVIDDFRKALENIVNQPKEPS